MTDPSRRTALRKPISAGRRAVGTVQQVAAERIVEFLRRTEPELISGMTEVGLLNRDWVETPGSGPMSTATPFEVLERTFASIVERRPSLLASVGLSAIEVLSASPLAGPRDSPPALLTVMFTDLEGFTRFTASHGDAAAATLLTEHYRAAGPIGRSRGGRVVKRLGDGLLMTFPEPSGAVLAALELAETPPAPLKLRAGLHVGEVVAHGSDVVGHVVNVAARVTELARGGEVLVTGDVRDAARPDLANVEFGRARRRRLEGIDERILVGRVRCQ